MVLEWSGLGMTLPKNSVLQIKNTQDLEKIKVFQVGKGHGNMRSVMSRNASWDQSRVIIEWVKLDCQLWKPSSLSSSLLAHMEARCSAVHLYPQLVSMREKLEMGTLARSSLQGSSCWNGRPCLKTKRKKRTNSHKGCSLTPRAFSLPQITLLGDAGQMEEQ